MKEPYCLTVEECLALHEIMLSQYGGSPGLRDANLLESALAKPRQLFANGKPTMAELAASYIFGAVKNHLFIDGNKRTGFILGIGFLERNGHQFNAGEADAALQILALAAGELTEAELALWLAANSQPISK